MVGGVGFSFCMFRYVYEWQLWLVPLRSVMECSVAFRCVKAVESSLVVVQCVTGGLVLLRKGSLGELRIGELRSVTAGCGS